MNKNQHLSGDERYDAIDSTMAKFAFEEDALLEVLNAAQEVFGYLSEDLLVYVSQRLNVSLSRVYGVSTFYHMFTFTPLGEHNCIICTGTACHVKGSDQIIQALSEAFDIDAGNTTADGLLSLTTARCLGSCGLAPVIVVDDQVRGKVTPKSATKHITWIVSKSREQSIIEPEVA